MPTQNQKKQKHNSLSSVILRAASSEIPRELRHQTGHSTVRVSVDWWEQHRTGLDGRKLQ